MLRLVLRSSMSFRKSFGYYNYFRWPMADDDDDDDGISSNFYFRWIRKFIILKNRKFTTPKMKQQNKIYTHSRKKPRKKRINHERRLHTAHTHGWCCWLMETQREMSQDEINTQINTNKLSSDLFMIRAHSQHHEKSRPENSRLFNDARLVFFLQQFVWLFDDFFRIFQSLCSFSFFLSRFVSFCWSLLNGLPLGFKWNFLSLCIVSMRAAMIKIAISAIYARRTWTQWIKHFFSFLGASGLILLYLFVFISLCYFSSLALFCPLFAVCLCFFISELVYLFTSNASHFSSVSSKLITALFFSE